MAGLRAGLSRPRYDARRTDGRDSGASARTIAPSDPIQRAQREGDFLSRRGAALKQYADAAAPLYKSLDDGQKQRFEVFMRAGRPHFHHFAFLRGDRGDRGDHGDRDRGDFRGLRQFPRGR